MSQTPETMLFNARAVPGTDYSQNDGLVVTMTGAPAANWSAGTVTLNAGGALITDKPIGVIARADAGPGERVSVVTSGLAEARVGAGGGFMPGGSAIAVMDATGAVVPLTVIPPATQVWVLGTAVLPDGVARVNAGERLLVDVQPYLMVTP